MRLIRFAEDFGRPRVVSALGGCDSPNMLFGPKLPAPNVKSAVPPVRPETITVETITGGTGRFAGASGTFTTARVGVIVSVVFVPGVGLIVTDTFTGTTEGQISY
jgi:hypothetical protein